MDSNFSLDSLLNVSAVPQDDRVAAFIAESKNNRSRCYEMSEQMTAAVATDGQSFKQYLDVRLPDPASSRNRQSSAPPASAP